MRESLIPIVVLAGSAFIGATAMAGTQEPDRRASPQQRQQARLQQDLARLTPKPPVDCIDTRFRNVAVQAVGSQLIYRESRNRIYISETAGGCEQVARGDILVTRQFGTRLCRGDIATTVDRVARFQTGACAIGPFTPYTKG